MSRWTELLREVERKDARLAADLAREYKVLSERRAFGLNFERHVPETVDLPGRPIRRGDKVRFLPKRGSSAGSVDKRLWHVASVTRTDHGRVVSLVRQASPDGELETATRSVGDLVVVAEFRDPIYPGLVSTRRVDHGGDKPFHTVINSENFHALQALLYTHEGKVDAIYIDPPYNSGARDWTYNNDYVDADDAYRHSKWLALMERRLLLAKKLLNPESSVLIITIDEKEYLRLGLLLESIFPESRMQMITSVVSSQASVRDGSFSRCNEFIFFLMNGSAAVARSEDDMLNEGLSATKSQLWFQFVRTGKGNLRSDRKGMFYPIFADPQNGRITGVGAAIGLDIDKSRVPVPKGMIAVWPQTADGKEGRWRTGLETARARAEKGLLRLAKTSRKADGWSVMSINAGTEARIASGEVAIVDHEANGAAILREISGNELRSPKTVWNKVSHNAGWHGSKLLAEMIPGRSFPYPKSLYAVEDALRFFVGNKPDATILDFFAGSGTTAHAVMRLNRQDNGRRRSISVTNNEVSADEQGALRKAGLRPGDPDWEKHGICDSVTQPRIEAAITGKTPERDPIKGGYKFTDEFPMSEGFEENAEFFTMTYEAPRPVAHNRAFEVIAPLLWLRAGSQGRRIETVADDFDVADTYGVLFDLDASAEFVEALHKAGSVRVAFIVTDDEYGYQMVCAELPAYVESVRLYESYLNNFVINTARE